MELVKGKLLDTEINLKEKWNNELTKHRDNHYSFQVRKNRLLEDICGSEFHFKSQWPNKDKPEVISEPW